MNISLCCPAAPARTVIGDNIAKDLVLTLDQGIENCSLIDYHVNSSTNCGLCDDTVLSNTVTCTNVQDVAMCTLEIETRLCGVSVSLTPYLSTMTSGTTSSSAPTGIVI